MEFITLPMIGVQSIAIRVSVCLSVCLCLSVHSHLSKPHKLSMHFTCGRGLAHWSQQCNVLW